MSARKIINLTGLLDQAEEGYSIKCRGKFFGVNLNAKNSCNDTLLHVAVGRRNEDEIRFLIAKGLDINACGDYNTTPLALAASFGSIDIIRLLMQLGADPDIKDCYGNSTKDLLWRKLCQ